ncbi:MAG: PAS domain S-box protein [Chitinispirillaceae bacterium]|nr:PAS domain S-box protein [Chitinispirillaceae bacterium]
MAVKNARQKNETGNGYSLGEVVVTRKCYCPSKNAGETNQAFLARNMELLKDFFQLLPYPVQIFDATGKPVMVNRAFLDMFGIESEKRYYRSYNVLKDDVMLKMGVARYFQRVLGGETVILPCVYFPGYPDISSRGVRRKDHMYTSSAFIPVCGKAGEKAAYVISIRSDITEQKKAEEQLRANVDWMRALLEGSSDMIQVLDEKGNLRYVSPAIKKLLGYDTKEPLGNSAFKIVHPDDIGNMQQKFAELLARPSKPLKVVCRVRHKNGSWRHVEAWAKNHLANRAVRGIILNIRDISEHIRAMGLLEASEEKFRNIVEQSRDGIAIIDARGTILIYNDAQERITGIKAADAVGKKIWDVQYRSTTPAMRRQRTRAQLKKVYEQFLAVGKSPWLEKIQEVEMVRPDGGHIVIQTVLFPFRINGTIAYATFNRDISAQKLAEQQLHQRDVELEERSKLLLQKNMALRELMDQVQEEKRKICAQIQSSIEQMVLPVLHRLKSRCSSDDRVYVDMLEENLKEVTAGFGMDFSSGMHHLTSKEIELCGMIRQGMTSKEIGRLLHISPRTVETHRNRIRKKLGIAGLEINMTTYLRSKGQIT